MNKLLLRLLINAVALYVAARVVAGIHIGACPETPVLDIEIIGG